MPDLPPPQINDMEALERFVAENDDLLALEEQVGKFNIFDALRIDRKEIRHSNFLAWLLDPAASHGQGDLFIKALLMELLRRSAPERRPLSPVLLDGLELHDVEVRREWKNVDLLLISSDPPFVVAVENKVDSGEHSNQLQRYEDLVRAEFPGRPCMFVFLAALGQEPSDDDWIAFSYADIHRVLTRVRKTAAGALGADVSIFLDHYLNLIGSRFMSDPTIVELCKRLYSNHRRAIDLIMEHAGTDTAGAHSRFTELIAASNLDCRVVSTNSRVTKIIPQDWLAVLPAIGAQDSEDPRAWLTIRMEIWRNKMYVQVRATAVSDVNRRNAVIEKITQEGNPFGFAMAFKTWRTQRRIALLTTQLAKWSDDEIPEDDDLALKAVECVQRLLPKLQDLPQAIAVAAMS